MRDPSYDLILVGSGFASSMFLYEYLRHAPPDARVLVLERGAFESHRWQVENRRRLRRAHEDSFVNRTPQKPWVFRLAFGGGSNCWYGCVPRMLPEDFELRSRYGVAVDWPLGYDDLEEYYCLAEDLLEVSGPSDDSPFPRSRAYPQPPHKLSTFDEALKRAYPDRFFVQPAARARRTRRDGRQACCSNGVCRACPIDAKFTIQNGMSEVYEDPRVELLLSAEVESLDVAGGVARGVRYTREGATANAAGQLVGLGANAVFNPCLLVRSGLEGPQVGRGLVEQESVTGHLLLAGLDNLQGSTVITGHGYMLYPGDHRRERAAALMETFNRPRIRDVRGRWLQYAIVKLIFEDLRREGNRVTVSADDGRPVTTFDGRSSYTMRAIAEARSALVELLSPLPIESIEIGRPNGTESHVLGTAVMGADPSTSVVDADLVHHRVRNLLVLGGSAFPTAAPANPTLTLSALSLRAARRLFE